MTNKNTLIDTSNESVNSLGSVVSLWADHVTDPSSPRRLDLLRDKMNAVLDFFSFINKMPNRVTPIDVKLWQAALEDQGLATATVYARISRVSSFYTWAIENGQAQQNSVNPAWAKASQSYPTEKMQSLDDDVQY